ncbi:immune inhibitor A [Phycicoccus badiiscoriae]|uniref:Immune inhibitor A n=1 Tax=Pedococcus badiiscoriae TaxID=642776 RepID=A0A852WHF2_9MICO|nr:immune inhibitor A [Pedococcus badiiscoriae]
MATAAIVAASLAVPAQATPVSNGTEPTGANQAHDLPNPLGDAQRALRKEAVDQLVKGRATTEVRGGQRVIKLKGNAKAPAGSKAAKDRFVSYPVEREEDIFTILTDFGAKTDPRFDATPGPVHNQIPKPDRVWDGNATDDNSTYWTSDFNRAHYQDLMFGPGESFKDFYTKQSNGRFLAKGDVSDWVQVPYNEARYGARNNADGYWNYIKDTATAWYDAQKAAGKTDADVASYLAQFDKVDRYDYDGDGNFNEPDGYIDHFQAIHAGEGEEAGGGAQGTNAIWSHRWYAYSTDQGRTGPSFNKLGGVPLGSSGLWIGDYTTEPENGGLGVFTHEFGHDLGLPDLYDTNGGDNGTGFWTLMSGGSWLNHGTDSIGSTPGYMGPWEKLQLGWLDYKVVPYGKDMTVKLGPADQPAKTSAYQALIATLPDKTVTTDYNTPHSGSYEWWGGSGDNLNTTLTRAVDLTGKSAASLSAWLKADIEEGYDYLFLETSTNGTNWTQVGAPVTGQGIGWTQKTWDLASLAGKAGQVRFRYATDGGLHYDGPFLDDLAITADGAPVFTDDVESGTNGWTASGFTRMTGSTSVQASHYYLAENRTYTGYDATLRTGPYNFGYANSKPDWVERFPYQNGMLVWYIDNEYSDNNTIDHPGGGQVLPVDARPAPVKFYDGTRLGNRRQPWDATFGLEATDAVPFHKNGIATDVPSRPGIPVFDDRDPLRYWSADNKLSSVQVAGSGTVMKVNKSENGGTLLQVQVSHK